MSRTVKKQMYLEGKVRTNANLLFCLSAAAPLKIKIQKSVSKINTQPRGYFFLISSIQRIMQKKD